MEKYFPTFSHGAPCLLPISISCLKLVVFGKFLGDIVDEDAIMSEIHIAGPMEFPTQLKSRPYQCVKRKRIDKVTKRSARLKKKSSMMTSEASIDAL